MFGAKSVSKAIFKCRRNVLRVVFDFKMANIRGIKSNNEYIIFVAYSCSHVRQWADISREFHPQDGGESQLASKLCHCQVMCNATRARNLWKFDSDTEQRPLTASLYWTPALSAVTGTLKMRDMKMRETRKYGTPRVAYVCPLPSRNAWVDKKEHQISPVSRAE